MRPPPSAAAASSERVAAGADGVLLLLLCRTQNKPNTMRPSLAALLAAIAAASPLAELGLSGRTGFLHPDEGVGSNRTGLFYWIFPATEVPPAQAPLVVWLQGGPGASSLLGQFFELGPHRLAEGSDGGGGGAEPAPNPAAWNGRANLVFIDQPFGTGFSYADDAPAGLVTSMPQMAQKLRLALVALAQAEADLAGFGGGRALWLTGESYAVRL